MNNGQGCVLQTRILVSERRHDEVVDALAEMMSGLQVGDPADEATDIGPLVAQRQQHRVQGYIALGLDEGARIVVGGNGSPYDSQGLVRPAHACSPTSTTTCASPRRRSSVRCSPVHPVSTTSRRGSHRQRQRLRPGRLGVDRRRRPGHGHRPSRSAPAPTASTMYTMDFVAPFGGFKQSASAASSAAEGLEHYLELQSTVSASDLPPLARHPAAEAR